MILCVVSVLLEIPRAAELRPDRLIHHVELGRCLLKMGMLNEAKAKFEVIFPRVPV